MIQEEQLNWEIINGVTGAVSAICAIISLVYVRTHNKSNASPNNAILTAYNFASFCLACSGWLLSCLCFLWIFEPFGSYPSNSDYKKFFGVLIAFPAITIFRYGLGLMSTSHSDNLQDNEKSD
jgi:uncharacterized membrane protein